MALPNQTLALLRCVLRRVEIHSRKRSQSDLSGAFASRFRGQGMVFQDVRMYQPGDDVRAIDWNVSARTNETHVKVFAEERELTVMLLCDASPRLQFGDGGRSKAELGAELAAILAFSANQNHDRVGLLAASYTRQPDGTMGQIETIGRTPKRGQAHVMRILEELAQWQRRSNAGTASAAIASPFEAWSSTRASDPARGSANTNFGVDEASMVTPLLQALRKMQTRRAIVFVLSDFLTGVDVRELKLAALGHDVVPVVLRDASDGILPNLGSFDFVDAETGEVFWIDSSDPQLVEGYRAEYDAARSRVEHAFQNAGLTPLEVFTDEDPAAVLQQFFAARKAFGASRRRPREAQRVRP
jgi:uncharacterized protein (DUF58 family)